MKNPLSDLARKRIEMKTQSAQRPQVRFNQSNEKSALKAAAARRLGKG